GARPLVSAGRPPPGRLNPGPGDAAMPGSSRADSRFRRDRVNLGLAMVDDGARPYDRLEQQLGYAFVNQRLCEQALTHKSWLNEALGTEREDNERLEFLGDAVLNLAVSDMLMRRFPSRAEGELSKTRAVIV